MKIIQHRVNDISKLIALPIEFGAEIDLRSQGDRIILNHDPFTQGDFFDEFASAWAQQKKQGTLILNPKEDGLESKTLEILKQNSITNFFFLDLTLPTTVKWAIKNNLRNIAVRFSEYEPLELALKFAGKVDWVWVDNFAGKPTPVSTLKTLKENFKTCLVSPELQGFPIETINEFKSIIPLVDAVCTKQPDRWKDLEKSL